MTVADYIAHQLFNAGVRHVFGIPGGPSLPYMEAFKNAGIEFILVANEAAAGIMADVSSRITGVPGVCHATFGPGATNISTGIGGALLDRSPVIVFTSEMSDMMVNRTAQMNISHQKLFEPLTRATCRLTPENTRKVLNDALTLCREEYPGPVHIGLPADIAGLNVTELADTVKVSSRVKRPADSADAVALLKGSRRPMLAAGLTAKRLDTGKELLSFLEKYNIPVVVTPMAKGLIPENHQCYAGVLFHAISDHLGHLPEKCDLIIGLGYDQVEYNYESWMPDIPLLHLDTRVSDMPGFSKVVQVAGEPAEWFSILSNLNPDVLIPRTRIVKGIREEMRSVFESLYSYFGPVTALKVLHDNVPDDTIVTADVGSHLHLLGQYWEAGSKGEIIMTNGWSGMGFGIPSALAAKLIRPQRTVVCITGDGGFLMMAGEMITARRNGLAVIVIVFSDGELNLIKLKQSWSGLPPYGTRLYRGDLFDSEMFLGVKVLKANSAASLEVAVTRALRLNEPVIINAIIDPEDYKYLIVKQKS